RKDRVVPHQSPAAVADRVRRQEHPLEASLRRFTDQAVEATIVSARWSTMMVDPLTVSAVIVSSGRAASRKSSAYPQCDFARTASSLSAGPSPARAGRNDISANRFTSTGA